MDLQKGIYPIAAKFISVCSLISCSFSSQGKNRLKGDCDKVGRERERSGAYQFQKIAHISLSLSLFYLRHVEDGHKAMKAMYERRTVLTKSLEETNFALDTARPRIGTELTWEMMWPWPWRLRDQRCKNYTG